MGAVSLTKYQWGCQLYGTIGFSYKQVLHNTLDLRNPLIRLEKKQIWISNDSFYFFLLFMIEAHVAGRLPKP